jgi:hypothetical protein
MATTYTLISSNVLTSSATSVTFSSIPQTYTDLVVRMSIRKDTSNSTVFVRFNGVTTSSYDYNDIQGTGSVTGVAQSIYSYSQLPGGNNMDTDLASTFSNTEMYIPSYTSSARKQISSNVARENNTTTSAGNNVGGVAGQAVDVTSGITSILISTISANWVAGSSFYLYGIKNS